MKGLRVERLVDRLLAARCRSGRLIALGVAGAGRLVALVLRGSARRAGSARSPSRFCSSGLCRPDLVHENRRPLKDIVAVVVDRSASQTIGERPRQTAMARDRLEASLKALDNVDVRVVETPREES